MNLLTKGIGSLILLAINFIPANSFAQWNYMSYHSTYQGPNTTSTSLIDACFFTPDTGFYSRSYYYSPSSGSGFSVLKTTNHGINWNGVFSGSGQGSWVTNFYTVNHQKTLYLGNFYMGSGGLKKTSNYGVSWSSVMPISVSFNDIAIPDTNHIYCIYSGTLSSKENGVYNSSKYVFQGVDPTAIYFKDSITGFIIAGSSSANSQYIIQKTSNGGSTWNTVLSNGNYDIKKIFFGAGNIGYAICAYGIVLKSIDNGENWNRITDASSVDLTSIWFLNDSVGFVSGVSGVIARTTNGGQTWTQDNIPTTNTIKSIYFVNDSIGLALAVPTTNSNGTTYQTNLNNPLMVWVEKDQNNRTLKLFPNPCTDQVVIQLPSQIGNDDITLKLSNIEGRSIKEENFQTLFSSIKWHLGGVRPGMYFITITSKRYTETLRILIE